jgi:hypothetical protein
MLVAWMSVFFHVLDCDLENIAANFVLNDIVMAGLYVNCVHNSNSREHFAFVSQHVSLLVLDFLLSELTFAAF